MRRFYFKIDAANIVVFPKIEDFDFPTAFITVPPVKDEMI